MRIHLKIENKLLEIFGYSVKKYPKPCGFFMKKAKMVAMYVIMTTIKNN